MFDNFYKTYGVKVPEGVFFNPCAGYDTLEPIELFGSLVEEMIFADIREVRLPHPNCDKIIYHNSVSRVPSEYREKFQGEIEKGIIEEVHISSGNLDKDISHWLNNYFNVNVGSIRNIIREKNIQWFLQNKNKINITTIKNDGFLSLLPVNDISVFFYRDDSPGEGGSGQWWFSQQLFKILTSKLVNGAIIVTDGHNFHPHHRNVSWSPLRESDNRKDFQFNDIYFEYIGEYEGNRRGCGVWRTTMRNRK